jgi:uncharacterized repeat protein (TIGR02543 family)
MANSILPSGEELKTTPSEILRYLNPDSLRQIFRQLRLHLNLKPNKDADYYSNITLYKYSGDLHNEVIYQRMEIKTFPDNGAYHGYAGVNNDSGEFGLVHDVDKFDEALSEESLTKVVNRTQIGAKAKVPEKIGCGLDDNGNMSKSTDNRMAQMVFDPYDGRAYLMTNDDTLYVNNETRRPETKLPLRTVARIADIPTRITDLKNDLDFVSDHNYHHTDNNFTNSNRFILDNIDDRTFVYPEIAKDNRGTYVQNYRVGLGGTQAFGEGDAGYSYKPHEVVYFIVTFHNDGVTYATKSVATGDSIGSNMPLNPFKSGFIFRGWSTVPITTVSNFNSLTIIESDITVYSVWEVQPPIIYKVTFNYNYSGSPIEPYTIQNVTGGDTIFPYFPTPPERSGYIFEGWSSVASAAFPNITGSTVINNNVQFYAIWHLE